jgi:hypothetical protein
MSWLVFDMFLKGKGFVFRAIDTTLSAICSGIVHSHVGACDPRGLFAKCVLHDDSHYALGVTSLRPSSIKIWSIAELFPLPLSAKSKPTSATTYGSRSSFMFLTSGKGGRIFLLRLSRGVVRTFLRNDT